MPLKGDRMAGSYAKGHRAYLKLFEEPLYFL
jgi:hypothetical protein